MLENVPIKGILHEMMITITTISREMAIKGIRGSITKEIEILPLHDMEMVNLQRDRETLGMMSLIL